MVQGVGLEYRDYNDLQGGMVRKTRVSSADLEWVLRLQGAALYVVRFESNFAKKHLYTSTKNAATVQAQLANFAHEPDLAKRLAQAKLAADEQKFKTQLAHRSPAEQKCVSPGCNHKNDEHAPGNGKCNAAPKSLQPPPGAVPGQKVKKVLTAVPCPCIGFTSVYADKRLAQGKPDANPLLGATGLTCDAIWMDRVDAKLFEKVVVDSIVARMNSLGANPWAVAGEEIEWDFGAPNAGCVLKVEPNSTLQEWIAKGYRKVTVTVKRDNKDPTKPIYVVCHLDGKKTA
jgi:hypothetical protein